MLKISRILLVLLFSVTCIAKSNCEVRTVNNVAGSVMETIPNAGSTGFNTSAQTTSFCPSRVPQDDELRWQSETKFGGPNFYMKRTKLGYYPQQSYQILTEFAGLSLLPQHIGLHEVMTFTNVSILEMEAALYYAWQPSIEAYVKNTGQNVTGIQILMAFGYGDSYAGFTEFGADIRRYIYTVNISDILHPDIAPVRQLGKYTSPALLPKIPSPNKDDFALRLETKRVIVYKGPVYDGQHMFLKGAPHTLDLEQIKRDLIRELETSNNISYTTHDPVTFESSPVSCNMTKGDVNVHFGTPYKQLVIPMLSNNYHYSQITATVLHYTVTVRDKFYVGYFELSDENDQRIAPGSIIGQNRRTISAQNIFRLHSSLPVNFQLLPILGKAVAKFLNDKLESGNLSTIVRFVDPDLDNATALNMVIELAVNNNTWHVFDSRLSHSQEMYNHLEGLWINLDSPAEPGGDGTAIQLSSQPFSTTTDPERQRFLQSCADRQIRAEESKYGECSLSDTFSLHLSQRNGQCPSTGQIGALVKEAFVEANLFTLDEAYFVVSLDNSEEIYRDADSLCIVQFEFSFSHFNLQSGKFWNVWRFPTKTIVRKLAKLNPPVTVGYSLRKHTNLDSSAKKASPGGLTQKSAVLSPDADAVLANSTFTLHLVNTGPTNVLRFLLRGPMTILREKSDVILRAVSAAFTEANSRKNNTGDQPPDDLTISLTGYDDDFGTLSNGLQVEKCDFALAYQGNGSDHHRTTWRYPSKKVLQMHLLKTASSQLTDGPFY